MTSETRTSGATPAAGLSCVALSGGVGGAKLALGLARIMEPGALMVVANTGDDFDHLGLRICPDLDTLVYSLAGLANPHSGWGRAGDTSSFMTALAALGGETWFHLGDKDLATHVERTRRLAEGETLTKIADAMRARLGVTARVVPMSDDAVATWVETADGPMSFQHYFVRRRCQPTISRIRFAGIEAARPQPEFLAALAQPRLHSVVICPSNPYFSIDPILAVPGVRAALRACAAPLIAVSPIVGGRALKGPTAKIMAELGVAPAASAVARHYGDMLDGFVIDSADAALADAVRAEGIAVHLAATVMRGLEDKMALARTVRDFAGTLRGDPAISQRKAMRAGARI